MSIQVFKKYSKLIKYMCLTTICTSTAWIYYQVRTTKYILANALDTSIVSLVDTTVVKKPDSENLLFLTIDPEVNGSETFLESYWKSLKFSYAKRLLILTNNDNRFVRSKAVRQLSRIKGLDKWQCSQLCSMIDARTAVGLARNFDTDIRFFNEPAQRFLGYSHDMLVQSVKDMLVNLHEQSQHPCMGYFLSKVFLDFDEVEKYSDDYTSFELKNYIQNSDELLIMCLESLLHHASIGAYSKDIVKLNGLSLLMEIHTRFKNNLSVTATISRIISYLSMDNDLLQELHVSGWIALLSQWAKYEDVRISLPSIKALINLDSEDPSTFMQRLYLLHPAQRVVRPNDVDVIFVHGLLGGVFFTWRQRKRDQNPPSFLGKNRKHNQESITQAETEEINEKCLTSHHEIIKDMQKQLNCETIGEDYDILWEDIPTKTNECAVGPFCTSAIGLKCDNNSTNCWPRDWLAKDCNNLRIIGINYETNLSLWSPMCPIEKVKTLIERSEELSEQLIKIGVGERPIVWVTHSMGGLIVKALLNKASQSHDEKLSNIFTKTKGLVFFSTPHSGSTVAKFNPASALVIWPSIEVQELQRGSPMLMQLHENFLKLLEKNPMKIVTFVETQPTVVSALKLKFLVVEADSGNPGCGEYFEIPLDHLRICKPASRNSFLYQKVLHLVNTIVMENRNEENNTY